MKTLLYDIENIGILGWTFGPTYEAQILHIEHYPHLLTVAWKWLDDKQIHVLGLDDFKDYKKDRCNDLGLTKHVWNLFNEADVVIGHNSKSFDDKMMGARFLHHRLGPPAPFKQLDTKQLAKRHARLTSNSLDNIGDFMGTGRKLKHGDFEEFWLGSHNGDPKQLKLMKKYNKIDVKRLEEWYLELRPYIENHPSLAVFEGRPSACRNCGSENIRTGMKYRATNTNLYQYFKCMDCGANLKSRLPEKNEKPLYV